MNTLESFAVNYLAKQLCLKLTEGNESLLVRQQATKKYLDYLELHNEDRATLEAYCIEHGYLSITSRDIIFS